MSGQVTESAHLPPPDRKEEFVREMFARIARQYDRMNRIMTLGRDRVWRSLAVSQALGPLLRSGWEGGVVLDVAAGTGGLALEAIHQAPSLRVVGVDLVPQMLEVAYEKSSRPTGTLESTRGGHRLSLAQGDALRLPFADGQFDAVLTGFAMRNVVDIPGAFAEMARVTRAGGRLACLEIAKPRLPLFRQLYAVYFYRMVPVLGRLLAGEGTAYTYLPHSLTTFLTPDEIVGVMRRAGWGAVQYRRLMLGTVALHLGTRL